MKEENLILLFWRFLKPPSRTFTITITSFKINNRFIFRFYGQQQLIKLTFESLPQLKRLCLPGLHRYFNFNDIIKHSPKLLSYNTKKNTLRHLFWVWFQIMEMVEFLLCWKIINVDIPRKKNTPTFCFSIKRLFAIIQNRFV